MKSQNNQVIDIGLEASGLNDKVKATHEAMHSGADVIYQAAFQDGIWMGHADFLLRVPHPSKLGEFSYEVADTKLARSSKAKFVVQLGFYSQMVAKVQGYTLQILIWYHRGLVALRFGRTIYKFLNFV